MIRFLTVFALTLCALSSPVYAELEKDADQNDDPRGRAPAPVREDQQVVEPAVQEPQMSLEEILAWIMVGYANPELANNS